MRHLFLPMTTKTRRKLKKQRRLQPPSITGSPYEISQDFFKKLDKTSTPAVQAVNEKSKQNLLEVTSDLPQPPFLATMVAPRYSGKTNCLLDCLLDPQKYCGKFDVIIIWSATFYLDSKWKNIRLPPGSVFTVFNESEVRTLLAVAEAVAKKKTIHSLWIFDDMISEGIMNAHRMGTLETVATRGRHANISLIIITQKYMALSGPVRTNATNTIIFRIRNGDELKRITDANRESLSADQFLDLYNDATNEPYQFLHVNNQQPDPKRRYCRNWNEPYELINF